MRVSDTPTFQNNSALGRALRVKLSGGYLVVAGASEDELGTLENLVLASDPLAAVVPIEYYGVREMVAAGSFSQFATLYAAASGKVDDSGTLIRGLALEASSGDGAIVRVLTVRSSITGTVARSNIVQQDAVEYTVPLTSMRFHDALATNLPASSSNDDMGLVTGTPGANAPTLQGADFGGTTVDDKCAFEFVLPAEYVAGETITVRANAGMLTTVSDGTATLDCEAWSDDGDGTVSSDLCTTSAQDINDLTAADIDFTITPTGLTAGDKLIVRLSFGGSDSGDGGVMIPVINTVKVLLDIKG